MSKNSTKLSHIESSPLPSETRKKPITHHSSNPSFKTNRHQVNRSRENLQNIRLPPLETQPNSNSSQARKKLPKSSNSTPVKLHGSKMDNARSVDIDRYLDSSPSKQTIPGLYVEDYWIGSSKTLSLKNTARNGKSVLSLSKKKVNPMFASRDEGSMVTDQYSVMKSNDVVLRELESVFVKDFEHLRRGKVNIFSNSPYINKKVMPKTPNGTTYREDPVAGKPNEPYLMKGMQFGDTANMTVRKLKGFPMKEFMTKYQVLNNIRMIDEDIINEINQQNAKSLSVDKPKVVKTPGLEGINKIYCSTGKRKNLKSIYH